MSCFRPNIGQRVKGSGDKPTIIRPFVGRDCSDDFEFQHLFLDTDSFGRELETFLVPCGKCLGCRLDYSREWSDRCYLESLTKSPNWFITLTYDDFNLPISEVFNEDEVFYVNSLQKTDLSNFIKRLRRYYSYHYDFEGFSFYACGEYGSRFQRPHYHLLIFGLPINDLVLHSYSDGFPTFNSSTISSIWNKGFVTINEFSWETASYVSRYCLKKQFGEDSLIYKLHGLTPEFSLMSRSPGIGFNFYENNKYKIFSDGFINIKNSKGFHKSPIPRYFEKLFERDEPLLFSEYKSRVASDNSSRYIDHYLLFEKDIPLINQRAIDERVKQSQIDTLRRNFESGYHCL